MIKLTKVLRSYKLFIYKEKVNFYWHLIWGSTGNFIVLKPIFLSIYSAHVSKPFFFTQHVMIEHDGCLLKKYRPQQAIEGYDFTGYFLFNIMEYPNTSIKIHNIMVNLADF
jgi:hypothetical protein